MLTRTVPSLRRIPLRRVERRWNSGPPRPGGGESPAGPSPHVSLLSDMRQEVNDAQRQFYRSFAFPVLKVVLGSMFVYQTLYWVWLKMEADEESDRKNSKDCGCSESCLLMCVDQIEGLKKQLAETVKSVSAAERK